MPGREITSCPALRTRKASPSHPPRGTPCQATHPVLWARGTLLPAPLGTATAPKQRQGTNQSREHAETAKGMPQHWAQRSSPERGSRPLLGAISLLQGAGWAPAQEGGKEGGRARTMLRRSPSLPGLCFAARPEASAHISVSAGPPRTKPKYSHSPGGHMRAGGRRGELLTPPLPSAGRGQAWSSPSTPGSAPWGADC